MREITALSVNVWTERTITCLCHNEDIGSMGAFCGTAGEI